MATASACEVAIEFLKAFGDSWGQHCAERFMTIMADEFEYETTAGPKVGGQRYESRATVRTAFGRVFADFPRHSLRKRRLLRELEPRLLGLDFHGHAPDGKRLEVKTRDVFTFKYGQISPKGSFCRNRRI